MEFLEKLLKCSCPSGYEEEAKELILDQLKSVTHSISDTRSTKMGSLWVQQGKGPRKILISAHYDEIGIQVSHITESGLLCIQKIGGLDLKVLPGSVIEFGNGVIGVIGKKPIHAETDEEFERGSWKVENIRVDIGATTKEEAESKISIGEYGVIKIDPLLKFGNSRIMARALDDKIGMYIVTKVAETLGEIPESWSIVYAGFCQEETGLRGAEQAIKLINPDYSIDVDVMFSTDDDQGIPKEKYGEITLGNGPIITHGSDKDPKLNKLIKETAKEKSIEYQEIVARPGGTNTSIIQTASYDCSTTHIGIPIRNLHTPVEICDWTDINGAIDLIRESILRIIAEAG